MTHSLSFQSRQHLTGSPERIVGLHGRDMKPRESMVMRMDAEALGAPRCHGVRLRIDQIALPSTAAYRFRMALVIDDDPLQQKLAKTYPLQGEWFSDLSFRTSLHLDVKRCVAIHVRRQAIRPWYRFAGEKHDLEKHLVIQAARPMVKEPETVMFAGWLRLIMAPPGGWN